MRVLLGDILGLTSLSQEIYVIDKSDIDGDVLFTGLSISVPLNMRWYEVAAIGTYGSALLVLVVVQG